MFFLWACSLTFCRHGRRDISWCPQFVTCVADAAACVGAVICVCCVRDTGSQSSPAYRSQRRMNGRATRRCVV